MNYSLICYKENGQLKGKITKFDETGSTKEVLIDEKEILTILGNMKEEKDNVSHIKFTDGDVFFNYKDTSVVLVNRKEFTNDDTFKFLFDLNKDKKYKVNKIAKKAIAIGLSALLIATTTGIGINKVRSNNKEHYGITYETTITNQEEESTIKVDKDNNISFDESTDEKVTNKYVDEDFNSITKPKNKEESTTKVDKTQNNPKDKDTVIVSKLDREEIAKKVKQEYGPYATVYSIKYGLDQKVVLSLICDQIENNSKNGKGILLTDISDIKGVELEVKNFKNSTTEKFVIDENRLNNLDDIDYAVQVVCVKYQNSLNKMENNQVAAIFYYLNPTEIVRVLEDYAEKTNRSVRDVLDDYTDSSWYQNMDRTYFEIGDIFKYYDYYSNNIIQEEVNSIKK